MGLSGKLTGAKGQFPVCHRALALLWVPSVDKNQHSHFSFAPSFFSSHPNRAKNPPSMIQICREVSSNKIFLNPYVRRIDLDFLQLSRTLLCV
jgi:hypothetical protein